MATGSVGVGNVGAAVSPEGVVVAVVGAGGTWGSSAFGEKLATVGEDSGDGGEGKEEGGEGNHDDD